MFGKWKEVNKGSLSTGLMVWTLFTASCYNPQREAAEKAPENTPVKSVSDDIVTTSVTDGRGNTLRMRFNNTAGTASLVLGTDTILLHQDTTASGIRYSHGGYIYREHQGEMMLSKDGMIIFEHKN